MAAKATGTVDVLLDANGAPVMAAIDKALKRIKDIDKVTADILAKSKQAAEAFTKGAGQQLTTFDKMAKRLEGIERTMQNLNRQPINQANDDRMFANRVRRVYEYQRSLKEASNSAQAFEARLAALDRKIVSVGNTGNVPKDLISKRLGLEQTERDFKRLQEQIRRTDQMAQSIGAKTSRAPLTTAESDLFRALKSRKSNVNAELAEVRRQADLYIAGVRRERQRINAELTAESSGGAMAGLFGKSGMVGVFARTAAYGGAAAVIYGIISALKEGVTYGMAFEDQLAKISAVADLTRTQNAELGDAIMQVGRNSRYATQDIAEASMVLAQAGFSMEDIKNSLVSVSNLAAASGVTFSEATDVMTAAIGAFQLQASDMPRVTDTLAAALNSTKLNIQQVALGIQYAGATAYENKISFEELTAVLATMAQAGIRSGSTMGTGLRQFLVDMMSPSEKLKGALKGVGLSIEDVNIAAHGLPQVLNRLSDAGFGAAAAYGALETRSAAAYLVLKNNQDILNRTIEMQNSVGAAAQQAEKGQASLAAEWQRFKNNIGAEVIEAYGGIADAIRKVIKARNDLEADEKLRKMREELDLLESGSDAWIRQIDAIEAYKEELQGAIELKEQNALREEEATTRANAATEAFEQQQAQIEGITTAIHKTIQQKQRLTSQSGALRAETASLTSQFKGLASMLYGTASSYDNLVSAMQRYRRQAIAIGALRAQEKSMALDQQARQQDSSAASWGTRFLGLGGAKNLNAQQKHALEYLARTPHGPDAANAARILYEISIKPGSGLTPSQANALKEFAMGKSRVGNTIVERNDASQQASVFGLLGTKSGQGLLQQIDGLVGKPDSQIKEFINEMARRSEGASPAKQEAYEFLINQAAALLQGTVESNKSAKADNKAAREAARKEREEDRKMLAIMRERQKADQAELTNAIKSIMMVPNSPATEGPNGEIVISGGKKPLTSATIRENLKRVGAALDKWVKGRLDLMNAEIDQQNMSGEQAELFRAEVMREIAAKREETTRDVVAEIKKTLDFMVEAAELVASKAGEAADHIVRMAEARMTALGRANMRGKVPDYTTAFYSRLNDQARDDRDREQININNTTIADLEKTLALAQDLSMLDWEEILGSDDPIAAYGDAMSVLGNNTEELRNKIQSLRNENEELKASFGGEDLIPKSFNEHMLQAIAAWSDAKRMSTTMQEDITTGLMGALDEMYSGMNTFFTDIISGSKSVSQAFSDMVGNMIKALQKLITEFLVKQAFKAILSLLDPTAGVTYGFYNGGSVPGQFNGGRVKGAYGGEHIRTGVPGRDSTLRNLSKGEFVMRRWAVDSVGPDFMRRLNDQGAGALKPAQAKAAPSVNQEVAVYVVKEDAKPQMGPKDVLVTVQEDILKDGQTKKLIKLVAQGA